MSDSTERLGDSQGTARMDAGTARMDASTARIDGNQSASSTGAGVIFSDGQTLVLNGKNCVIEKLISMGSGEAVVYKIQIDGKPYALKHYKPKMDLSDTAKKLLAKIRDNPRDNVVRIIDFGRYNDQDFEIMEYAEGGTLHNYIKKTGGVKDISKLKSIVKQLNEGLQQLHGYYKAIYQDLKPENIFFKDGARSSLVLADFGISSVMQDGSEEVEVIFNSTDLYGAPELAIKAGDIIAIKDGRLRIEDTKVIVTPAVDYFALGITLYELWLGEQPFKEIKPTTRERRIQDGAIVFPIDMPEECKTLIQGLIEFKPKDRMGNEHVQKWLKGETLSLDKKSATVASTVYKPLKFGDEVASNPKEIAALMEKYPEVGKTCLYKDFITQTLKEANDVTLFTEIENVIAQYGNDQEAGLTAAIYTLDPERPFKSRKGKTCKTSEEIADAINDDQAHYMEELRKQNTSLYIYIAVTGGSQGKEDADHICKYCNENPGRAINYVYLKLQSDGSIPIGSKRYLSTDELAQEKDQTQIDLIKKAVKEKDSQLLVWLADEYSDYLTTTDEFSKLSIPEQFFLLGKLPFLSFKELSGSNGEAALKDLIDNYPGRPDLFDAYVAQGLPLKGQILDNAPHKKTPIDYVVHNFNELAKRYSRDTIFDLISHLHRLGADVNEYSEDGTCPLINAYEANNDDLVNRLLELRADPNQYRQYKEHKEEQERIERERHEEQERIEREQREEQERKERERREEQERKERERREEQEKKDRAERERQRKRQEAAEKREKIKNRRITVFVLLIIAIICGYFINQCTVKNKRNADLYNQATTALSEGDYKTAINNFQSLGAYSDSNMKLSQAAEIALSQGDYEAAINCCKSLREALDLISQNDQSGGDYTIILKENQKINPVTLGYGGKPVTITLKASEGGKVRKVSFDEANAPLFTVTEGVTLVLEDRVVLNGDMLFSKTLVSVDGGSFIMNGGALSGCNGSSAVNIKSGAFTMNGGEITKNGEKKMGHGGGVCIDGGTFTMNSGSINGNWARIGGGVYITGKGVFTMTGGTISGNDGGWGGGVSVNEDGIFNMLGGTISGHDNLGVYVGYTINKDKATFTKAGTGGVIYGSDAPKGLANAIAVRISRGEAVAGGGKRWGDNEDIHNTTALESTALDSRKRGAEGGWE